MDDILADVSNAGNNVAPSGKADMSGKKSKKQGKDRTSIINAVIGPLDEVDDENVESVSSRSSTGRRMTASPGQIASFIAGLDKSGSSNGSNASRQNAESQLNLSSSDSDDSPAKSNPPREVTAFDLSSSTAQLSAAPAPVMPTTIPTVPGLPLPEALEHDLHDDYADVWGNFGAGRESMLVRMGGGRQSIIPADIADLLAEDSGMEGSGAGDAGRRASMMPPPPPPSSAAILPPADPTVNLNSSTVGPAGGALGTASKGGHRVKTPGKSLMKGTAGATTGRKRNVVFGSPQAAIVDQTVAVEAAGAITHLDPQLAKQAYGMHKSEPELGRLSFDDQTANMTGGSSMSMSMLSAAAPVEEKESAATVPASPAGKIVGDGMDGDGDVIMAMTPAPKAAAAASAPFASPSGRPPRAPSTPKSAQKAAALAAEQASAAPTVRRSPRLSSVRLPDPSPIVTAPGSAAFPTDIAAAAGAFNGAQTVVLASMGSLDDSLALPPSAVAQTTTGLDAATKAQVAAVTVAPVGRSLSPKAGMAAAGAAMGVKAGGAKGANRRATFSVVPGLGLVMGGAELPRRQVRQAAAAAPGPMAPPPVPAPAPPKPSPAAAEMDGSMDMDLAADRTVGSVDMRKLDMLLGDQSLSDSMLQATPAAMFSKAPQRRSSGKKGAAAAPLQTQQSAAGDITVSLGLTGSSMPAFPVAAGAPAPTGGIFGVSGLLGARGKKGGALQAQVAEDVTVQAPTTLAGLLASERAAAPSTAAGARSMDVTTSLPTSLSALMRGEGLRAGSAHPFVLPPQPLGDLSMGAGYGMGGGMQEEEEGEEESMLAEGASMLGVAGGMSMVQERDALDVTAHLAAEGVKPVVRPATPQQKKVTAAGKRKGAGSVSNRTAADLDLSGDSDQSTSSVDTAAIVEEEARLLERAMPGLTPNRAAMLASTRAAGSAAKAASAGKSRSAASVDGNALSFDAVPVPAVAHRKYADAETNTSMAVVPSEAAAQGSTSSSRSSTKRGVAQISAEGSATHAEDAPGSASSKRSRRSSAAASTRSTATSVAATVAVGTATSASQLHASVSSTSAAISVRSSASGTSSSSASSSTGGLLVDIDGLHMPTITGRLSMAPPKAHTTHGMLIDTDGLHMSSPTGTRAPSAMATVAPAAAPVHQPVVAAVAERMASPALVQPQGPTAEPAQASSAAAPSPAAVPATPAAPTPAPVATPATRAPATAATAKKSTGGKSRAAAAAEAARIEQEQAAAAAEEMNRQLKEQELAVLASAAAESALGWLPPLLQGTGWSIVKAEPQAQQAAAAVSLQHMHPDGSAHTLVVLVTQADSPVQAVACQHVASTSPSAQEASGYEQGGIAAFHKAACKNAADAVLTQLASASVPLQSVCAQATSLFAAVNALCGEVASVRAGHAVRFTEEEEQGEGSGVAASWCIAMDFMRGQRTAAVKARVLLRLPLAADCSAGGVYSYPSLAEALRMEVQVHAGPVTIGAALGQAMQVAQVEHLACRSGKAGLLAALAKAGAEEMKRSK